MRLVFSAEWSGAVHLEFLVVSLQGHGLQLQ